MTTSPAVRLHNQNSPVAVNILPTERCLSVFCGSWLVLSGVRRGLGSGKVRFFLGAEMLRRGISGHSYVYEVLEAAAGVEPRNRDVIVRLAMTIGRPREEVFRFWRNFANLSRVMNHLASVKAKGNGITRWTIRGPLGIEANFDAEVVNESENKMLVWRSLPDSEIFSTGSVTFRDGPQGFGTEIDAELQYSPPAGRIGLFAAKLSGLDARSLIEADCWRLKEYLETGEVSTTEGQPAGPSLAKPHQRHTTGTPDISHPMEAAQ